MIAYQLHGSRDLNRNILFAMGKNFERSEMRSRRNRAEHSELETQRYASSPCATLVTLSPSSSGGDMWL
jgi:hypothetical protein